MTFFKPPTFSSLFLSRISIAGNKGVQIFVVAWWKSFCIHSIFYQIVMPLLMVKRGTKNIIFVHDSRYLLYLVLYLKPFSGRKKIEIQRIVKCRPKWVNIALKPIEMYWWLLAILITKHNTVTPAKAHFKGQIKIVVDIKVFIIANVWITVKMFLETKFCLLYWRDYVKSRCAIVGFYCTSLLPVYLPNSPILLRL